MVQDRHLKIDTGGPGEMGEKEKQKQLDTVPHAALAVVAGLGEITVTYTCTHDFSPIMTQTQTQS